MKTITDIASAVEEWTKDKLNFRASFYTGRGVTYSDLNAEMLEGIYQGLKRDVGQQEATNFAKLVANLKDLSASAFIQAFERFWYGDCKNVDIQADGDQITGNDEEREVEAFILVTNALFGGSRMSPGQTESASVNLKMPFLQKHTEEIGADLLPAMGRYGW